MKKYKFSESEQDDLKVAKYNQDIGDKLREDFHQIKTSTTTNK